MMTRFYTAILLMVICSFIPVKMYTAAQVIPKANENDTIHFAIDLRLGMTKDYVISSLSQSYRLQKLGLEATTEGQSMWLVEDKNNPSQVYGTLSFERDKLTTVTRYWNSAVDSDFGFATALYRATSNFKDEHRIACVLDSGSKENPSGTSKSVFLLCGGKTIEIAISNYDVDGTYVKTADIVEILGKR